jgi:CTP:molybdopterin cytidylyltransferase MocA
VTTAAVVLAAGGGTRFAGPAHKLVSAFRGRPLWRWAFDHADGAGLDHVIVVTGAVDLDAPAPAITVVNAEWSGGIATSLAAGIRAARELGCGAVVAGLADQPLVSTDAWRAVAGVDTTPVAIATYDGRRGHPVRLAAEVWSLLPVSGDEGARVLMRERPGLVTEVACAGSPVDVDTVEDLDRWT